MRIEDVELDALVAEKVMDISLRADTRSKIGKAVMHCMGATFPVGLVQEFHFHFDTGKCSGGQEYRLQTDGTSKFGYGGADGNDGYGLYFWDQRVGAFYQDAIEKHVERWRDTAPRYSTDIAAAWQVVEKMWVDGWDGDVEWYPAKHAPGYQDGQRMYRGRFARVGDQEQCELAFSHTAPRAICLAALRAVGVSSLPECKHEGPCTTCCNPYDY